MFSCNIHTNPGIAKVRQQQIWCFNSSLKFYALLIGTRNKIGWNEIMKARVSLNNQAKR